MRMDNIMSEEQEEIKKHWTDVTPGWILKYEEAFLQALASTLKDGSVAINIGGGAGTSSSAILRGTKDLEKFFLYSVDLEECEKEIETLIDQELLAPMRVSQVVMPSNEFPRSRGYEGGDVDLVFVDGSHKKETVFEDLELYSAILKEGGLLVCHDYEDPRQKGVTEAIHEWIFENPEWIRIGRVNYTIAFMKTDNLEWAKGRI